MQIIDYPSFLNIQAGMSLTALVSAIFNFLLIIAGLAAFIMIVWGGVKYLTSAGDPARTKDAKNQVFMAILGLIILFSSWMILNTINPNLVDIKKPADLPPPMEIEQPEPPVGPPAETPAAFDYIPLGQIIDDLVMQEKETLPKMKDFADLSTQCNRSLCEGGTCIYPIPCPIEEGDSGGVWNWQNLICKVFKLFPVYAQGGCSASCSAPCNTGDPCPANKNEVASKVLTAADQMEKEIVKLQQAKNKLSSCLLEEGTSLLSCQEVLDIFQPTGGRSPFLQWDEIQDCRQGYDFYCIYGSLDEESVLDEIILPFETIKESIASTRELADIIPNCACSKASFCCACCDACSGDPCPAGTNDALNSASTAVNELEKRLKKLEETIAEISFLSSVDEFTTLTCSEAYSWLKSIRRSGCPGVKVFPCCPIDQETEKIIRECNPVDFFFCSVP